MKDSGAVADVVVVAAAVEADFVGAVAARAEVVEVDSVAAHHAADSPAAGGLAEEWAAVAAWRDEAVAHGPMSAIGEAAAWRGAAVVVDAPMSATGEVHG
jgi:hypothetical protein